jgi:alcohol dehydrogenase YqhD (iron-dependent ADH family)
MCRKEEVDFILAVGGGSVIDSAKAIALGINYAGNVWDYFTGKAVEANPIPLGVILTISAAGSETGCGTVITNEDGWYKRAYGSDLLRPKFAILNPELTFTVSPYQTASGVADSMAHILERYFTNTLNVGLTDKLCEGALKTIIENAPLILNDPNNYHARAEVMWASTLAHNDLFGTGRIADWASHNIEHELSGIYDVTHGAGLAAVIPAWMRFVYTRNPCKISQFATEVFDVEKNPSSPEATALEGINKIEHFFKELGLPTTLQELNIPADRLREMAHKCTESGPVGNYVCLEEDDVYAILTDAL